MTEPLLAQFLASNDAACPVCGYGLRGLKTDRCPECGVPIRLGVHTPDRRFGSWVTGLVTFSMATGFLTIMTVFMLSMGVLMSSGGPGWDELWPIIVGTPIGLASVGGLVVFRRPYRKAPLAARWGVNAAGNAVLLGLIGYWLYIIM